MPVAPLPSAVDLVRLRSARHCLSASVEPGSGAPGWPAQRSRLRSGRARLGSGHCRLPGCLAAPPLPACLPARLPAGPGPSAGTIFLTGSHPLPGLPAQVLLAAAPPLRAPGVGYLGSPRLSIASRVVSRPISTARAAAVAAASLLHIHRLLIHSLPSNASLSSPRCLAVVLLLLLLLLLLQTWGRPRCHRHPVRPFRQQSPRDRSSKCLKAPTQRKRKLDSLIPHLFVPTRLRLALPPSHARAIDLLFARPEPCWQSKVALATERRRRREPCRTGAVAYNHSSS